MTKVVLHIGAHKTGTTSFQSLLDHNRQELLVQDKVLFPSSCKYHFSQHRLAFALKGMRDPSLQDVPDAERELSELAEECRRATREQDVRRIIISSEEFFTVSDDRITLLVESLLKLGSGLEVCAVVRRQDNQLLSMYNQRVKTLGNGYHKPIGFYLKNLSEFDDELFYGKHLRRWKDVLRDRGMLTVFFYEDHEDTAAALCKHMLGRAISVPRKAFLNESVSAKYLECMRHLKILVKNEDLLKRLAERARKKFPKQPNESLISYEERQRILEFFEEDNRLLEEVLSRKVPYGVKSLTEKDKLTQKTQLNLRDALMLWVEAERRQA